MSALAVASVNAEIQRAITAVTPDTFFDVTIEVRKDGRQWRETVRVACVSVIGGANPLWAERTRTEFPEFTVLTLGDSALVIPTVSVCGRAMDLRRGAPMLTDSAAAPTWVSRAEDLGVEVELSSTRVRAADNERVVRDHYRRLRDETSWGAIMGTVEG
ncbi:MAG: hypothetical protein ACREH4_16605, partial [Vitreimonas sp.]